MNIFLWVLLGLFGILIAFFHIKTYRFNKYNRNLIIASFEKDVWPYRLLWGIWLILLLFFLLSRFDITTLPSIHRGKNVNETITKEDEIIDTKPIYRQIIDQKRQEELIGNKKATINPIIPGYYELITEDKKLIQSEGIVEGDYIIPHPINIAYCKAEDKYRNLLSTNGLSYNEFIYEYLNSNKKKDIVIGVLDTGITQDNEKLSAHLVKNGQNVITQDDDTKDYLGHGSHIAGIILQTFPNARILPIKVSDNYGETVSKTDIIAGLRYAIDQGVDIINMSFGGYEKDLITSELINEAVSKGILVIAAAGNESQNVTLYYPANYGGVVSVGSIGKIGKSDFSNYGADIEMPGECIYSTSTGGKFAFMDGTSMSAPHLAGIIGGYLSLDNKISQESEIIKLITENIQTGDEKSILNMPKLFNIEDQNNKILENLNNIKSILNDIHNKLISLESNLTEHGIKEVVNYIDKNKVSLEKNAKEIEDLYKSLNISEGFGVGLTEKVDSYINTLKNLLNKDSIQLISKDSVLGFSLGTETCRETFNKCTAEEKKNGCDDNSYVGYICGYFDIIITGGVNLPSKGSSTYLTMRDYQDTLNFPVYQGQNKFVGGNKYIGEVKLSGIPKKLAGQASATVYFEIDKYGFLSVEAVDDSNGNNRAIKTKLTPATDSVENKGDDYDNILNNVGYALNETKEFIVLIDRFSNINPWDYVSQNVGEITSRIDHITTEIKSENNIENNINENVITSNIPENIKVDKVVDGDTIRVFLNGESTKVRLIGVEAPESNDTRYGYTECYGQASSNYLSKLLSNKTVGLEYDSTQGRYDKYDRILAYIFLDGENINEKMISDGYAWEYTYNLPYKYQKEFKEAESQAESLKKGLRNKNTCNGEHRKGN